MSVLIGPNKHISYETEIRTMCGGSSSGEIYYFLVPWGRSGREGETGADKHPHWEPRSNMKEITELFFALTSKWQTLRRTNERSPN